MHGKVLDIKGGEAKGGTKIQMYSQNNPRSANQLWTIQQADNEHFWIVSALDPNLVWHTKFLN